MPATGLAGCAALCLGLPNLLPTHIPGRRGLQFKGGLRAWDKGGGGGESNPQDGVKEPRTKYMIQESIFKDSGSNSLVVSSTEKSEIAPLVLSWKPKKELLSYLDPQRHGFLSEAQHAESRHQSWPHVLLEGPSSFPATPTFLQYQQWFYLVEKAINNLAEDGKRASAVLVISPTYHGVCSKLNEISEVCHSHGIPVIVDEAHGAHFKFHHGFPNTALEQGADLIVQSTHKVLCSLAQSSMLHMSGNLVDKERIGRCLQTLQSTSASYLLLASLDAARAQLSRNPDSIFDEAVFLATEVRNLLKVVPGISVMSSSSVFSGFPSIDPLRVTICVSELGLSGYEADDILAEEHGIMSELAGTHTITFAINLGTRREDIQRLASGIKHLSTTFLKKNQLLAGVEGGVSEAPFSGIHMNLNPRDAFFAKKRKVGIWRSIGEICGELICPYPPGDSSVDSW